MESESIVALRAEIKTLEETLASKKAELQQLLESGNDRTLPGLLQGRTKYNDLSSAEITRYSRQMLVPDITVDGQKKLKNAKVLIVGAGGLGCPSSLYLASAGVGEITIVDYDEVELTNLHRQVLHSECDIGRPKVESACEKLRRINSDIKVTACIEHVNNRTIRRLLKNTKYDAVLDCTDNVATRYLLNDACVLNDLPLISGSALKFEGQLTVYNYEGGPCFRCVFPVPPPPAAVTNCGDGGVLGPVPGVIGTLQALEAIKIIVGTNVSGVMAQRMLLFEGSESVFRDVKLRRKNPECAICGESRKINDLIDYEQFCGSSAHDKVKNINILTPKENVNIHEFMDMRQQSLVVDVRPNLEYNMCHIEDCINIPLSNIDKGMVEPLRHILKSKISEIRKEGGLNVLVLCRRGNDSQRAVTKLKQIFADSLPVTFINVKGGLHAYSKKYDPCFPVY